MQKNRNRSESALLRAFERMLAGVTTSGVVRGVGDDAAILRPRAGEDLLLTNDALVEGRHFRRRWLTARELGWRLASVNLSDIAGMGGSPRFALMSLAIPDGVTSKYILDVQRGARDHLARHGAVIVGGNVSGIGKTLVCDMTLVGAVKRGRHWLRTCRPGRDVIVVAGGLGEARAGIEVLQSGKGSARLVRAWKKPKPLLEVARVLNRDAAIHGAIDVSDGFALDLVRMCEKAGAGCVVESSALSPSGPLAEHTTKHLDYMLHGGEDYALILAVDEHRAEAIVKRIRERTRVKAAVVGRFTRARGRYEIAFESGRRRLRARGWDHLLRRRA